MKINTNIAVHNYFTFEVRDAATNELLQTARAENIVLDQYFSLCAKAFDGSYEAYHNFAIAVGRGTGVLSRTRGALFNTITSRAATLISQELGSPTGSVTKEITLGVNEFIGEVLTEVGFVTNFNNSILYTSALATHALLQDSAGNPISITKTDTNIIIIRGVFYATVQPGTGLGANGVYHTSILSTIRDYLLGINTYNWRMYILTRWPVNDIGELHRSLPALTEEVWNAEREKYARCADMGTTLFAMAAPSAMTWDPVTKTITAPVKTFGETDYPNQVFRSIGSLFGMINLPDHDFFPPVHLVGKVIGAGDGVTTEFNIGVPVIMPNTEKIYIDNVLKVKGVDYSIEYDNNCVDMYENFFSCQYGVFSSNVEFGDAKTAPPSNYTANFLHDPILWASGNIRAGGKCKLPASANVTQEKPIWFDFLEPKRCNITKVVGPTVPAAQINNLVVEYSTDNLTWTPVTNLVRTAQVWRWDVAEARYWRVYIPGYTWVYPISAEYIKTVNGLTYRASFFLGMQIPGLKFTTPPALNANITADFDIDVIFKTANNVLRYQWAVKVDTGAGS